MNEQELRQLVREVLERQAAPGVPVGFARGTTGPSGVHPSHHLFAFPAQQDDRCLIEPVVACTHCGYCKSYGH